jgi:hypothetical protein
MYIPKSNIIETGYSQGTEFVVEATQLSYKGYYFKDNLGNYWSGQESTASSVKLQLIYKATTTDPSQSLVNIGFTKAFNKTITAVSYSNDFITPTQEDYNNGYFVRYIAKLKASSQPTFIEINKDHFNEIYSSSQSLYTAVQLYWKLTGPLHDKFNENVRIDVGVEDANLRSIQEAKVVIFDIDNYLTNPTQYAKIIS